MDDRGWQGGGRGRALAGDRGVLPVLINGPALREEKGDRNQPEPPTKTP